MTRRELAAWSPRSRARFAQDLLDAGLYAEREAVGTADRVAAGLLPDGVGTPGHHLWTTHVDDATVDPVDDPTGDPGSPVDDATADPVVGHLWLQVQRSATGAEAYVMDVDVEPDRRGHGLGRATMTAAERAARDLDASVLRLSVFAHNRVAVALYDGLGYVVTDVTMVRWLDGPPGDVVRGVAPVVGLRDVTAEEYTALRPVLEAGRAADLVRSGSLPADAVHRATRDLDRLLPWGPGTSGHRLWTAVDGDAHVVGHAWLGLDQRPDGLHAHVLHLGVPEGLRGQGYGRALALAGELECRRLGVRSVQTSVPAAVRSWGERHGLRVTAQTRMKRLPRPAPRAGRPDRERRSSQS